MGPQQFHFKNDIKYHIALLSAGLVIETNFDIDFDSNIRNLNNFDFDFDLNIHKLKNFDFDSISIRYIEIISIFDFDFDFSQNN
jgi:hypothetical protein